MCVSLVVLTYMYRDARFGECKDSDVFIIFVEVIVSGDRMWSDEQIPGAGSPGQLNFFFFWTAEHNICGSSLWSHPSGA